MRYDLSADHAAKLRASLNAYVASPGVFLAAAPPRMFRWPWLMAPETVGPWP
jgi:hypothetical protein